MGLNIFQVLDLNSNTYFLHCGLLLFLHFFCVLQTNQSMHRHFITKHCESLMHSNLTYKDQNMGRPTRLSPGPLYLLPLTALAALSFSSLMFCLGPIKNTLEALRESVQRLWESRKPFRGLVSRALPPASETVSCALLDLFLFHCVTLPELPPPQIYLG